MPTDGSSPNAPQRDRRAGDIWGGLAGMLVAFPAAMGFGLLIFAPLGPSYAGSGAMAGILGAITMGIVAPIFGGTPRLVTSPCGPAAAVMAALAAVLFGQVSSGGGRAPQPEQVVLLLTLVAALAGVLQILFGAVGGGRLIKYIPYPVVAGYLTGVGILIVMSQIANLLGFPKGTGLWTGLASPGIWNWPGVIVGVVTMAAMVLAPRITRAAPAAIFALVSGLLAYAVLSAVRPEMRSLAGNPLVIGPIVAGESTLGSLAARWATIGNLPMADLRAILIPALTLGVLLSIDTLKTCVVVDALTRTRHQSNRELLGQGLGNLASAVAGGIPGAGGTGATLVNLSSGGATRLSGVLAGVFALVAFLVFGGVIGWVPIASIAGILSVVSFRAIDFNSLHLLQQKSTILDFVVVAAVVGTTISVSLISAAGVGLGLAILLFVRDQIRGSVVRRKTYGDHTFSKRRRLPEEIAILEKKGGQTAIYELQGSLFFGTTDQLFSELEPDLKTRRYVILDMRRVHSVDFTATHMLQQIEAQLGERGGSLIFSDLPPHLPTGQDLEAYFDQVGLVRPSRHVKIFEELDDALEWTEDQLLIEENLLLADEEPWDLDDIDLVKGLDTDNLQALAGCIAERSFEAGQRIFSEGDAGDELYLIRRGTVRILLPLAGGRAHHLATFGQGDFFGDMSFLDHAVRSADAVAKTVTDLYVLSRAKFDAVANEHPRLEREVFARLARVLAIRLRQTDTELRALEEA